jgi:hypothetical protein
VATLSNRTGSLTMATLRRAAESRDADLLLSLYTDDAVLTVVDSNNPPSRPLLIRGKTDISRYIRDVYTREMTHQVEDEVVGTDRLSYLEACRYADGTRVLGSMVFDLHGGKVTRHKIVQAWDE